MGVVRTAVLSILAAVTELGGIWSVWQGVRGNHNWLWAGGGFLALALYESTTTFQGELSLGRIMAAYGGLFIAGALAWGIVADGYRLDHWDLTGAGTCLIGAGMVMFAPCGRGIWKVSGSCSTQTRNRSPSGSFPV